MQVPIDDAARLSVQIAKDTTLTVYPGAPHGLANTTMYKDTLNQDLLAFLRRWPGPMVLPVRRRAAPSASLIIARTSHQRVSLWRRPSVPPWPGRRTARR